MLMMARVLRATPPSAAGHVLERHERLLDMVRRIKLLPEGEAASELAKLARRYPAHFEPEHDCECNPAMPGILWPWGADGEYPPALPYVERCDQCQRFPDDAAAARELAKRWLPRVGLMDPLIGQHRVYKHGVHGPKLQRVMWYVFPSPAAIHFVIDEEPAWILRVDTAKSSLENLHRSGLGGK